MFKKLKNFFKETSGNFAVNGVLLMTPVLLAGSAALDYSNFQNQKDSVQSSLDAAGLAAGRELAAGATESELAAYAEGFFLANLDPKIDQSTITFSFNYDAGDGSIIPPIPATLTLSADFDYDTLFGTVAGIELYKTGKRVFDTDEIATTLTSQITLGNRTVEIALVLDNSGSMGGTRLSTLKTESKNLVDIVFNSSALTDLPDPVKFSLVPFAGSVNVGTSNINKKWMDKKGWSPIHHENFDWDTYRTNNETRYKSYQGNRFGFQEKIDGSWKWKTRKDVYSMLGQSWGGCVEMRPWPHNTMDTYVPINQSFSNVKNAMDADGDGVNDGNSALFVYSFAPDEPDNTYRWSDGYHYYDDDGYGNSYLYDWKDYNPSTGGISNLNADTGIGSGQYWSDNQINRTNWMFKYQVNQQSGYLSEWRGPNYNCSMREIETLSTNQNAIKSSLDQMQANGSTNIQQGLTWGWRTLSDNEPFTEGRENSDIQNMKFVILLTDGNNFYSTDGDSTPNQTSYGAWGYARTANALPNPLTGEDTHNRWLNGLSSTDLIGTIYENSSFDTTPESYSDFELIMNAHTNQACRNIKNDEISVFTIAFDVPSNSSVKSLLEACAGSGIRDDKEIIANGQFYFDVNGSGLEVAMQDIANQIANLRISQ